VLRKLLLKDGFHHHLQGGLRHPIPHRGHPQRPFLGAPQLWYPYPFDRLGLVGAFLQVLLNGKQPLRAVFLEVLHRDPIHAATPSVGLDLFPSQFKHVQPAHFINQAEPLASFALPLQGRQHLLAPDSALCSAALPRIFSALFIPCGN